MPFASTAAPRVLVTAESDDFDDITLEELANEGFFVKYVPMGDGGREYGERLDGFTKGLGVGESLAIVGTIRVGLTLFMQYT